MEKQKLIAKVSKMANISSAKAKIAYETILKESPAFRQQKLKTVKATKEKLVKVKGKPTIKKVNLIQEVLVEVIKEIEVISEVEVIKEVPVEIIKEVIKEVEVVKEVPVEVIKEITLIKEVEVVKEVPVIKKARDNKGVAKLQKELSDLRAAYEIQIKSLNRKLRSKPKEVIKEIVKEVPVEIIKEIEVVKSIDFDTLKKMMAKMGTVQVSKKVVGETRTEKEAKVVSRREIKSNNKSINTSNKRSSKKDDLKKIEGIGPKIESLLNKDGIHSFRDLAVAKVGTLKKILDNAGSRFQMHDPATWGQQSKLAASGDWDKLNALQEALDGGKKK